MTQTTHADANRPGERSALRIEDWMATRDTRHTWLQIVGQRLGKAPFLVGQRELTGVLPSRASRRTWMWRYWVPCNQGMRRPASWGWDRHTLEDDRACRASPR
jgi:hypothetical protein